MKKYFVTGLIVLLPLVITLGLLVFLVNLLTKPFVGPIAHMIEKWSLAPNDPSFLTHQQMIEYGSRILALLLIVIGIVLLGIITRWFFMHALLKFCDKVLMKIPFVRAIYKTAQDIIKNILGPDKNPFKKVVMVQFPRPGIYVLGLIAKESPETCSQALDKKLISVLVPTTPNPTTGFLLMLPEEELVHIDMKAEDAIKYIVSCGVIVPEEKS